MAVPWGEDKKTRRQEDEKGERQLRLGGGYARWSQPRPPPGVPGDASRTPRRLYARGACRGQVRDMSGVPAVAARRVCTGKSGECFGNLLD